MDYKNLLLDLAETLNSKFGTNYKLSDSGLSIECFISSGIRSLSSDIRKYVDGISWVSYYHFSDGMSYIEVI